MNSIWFEIVVEDRLSENILRKVVQYCGNSVGHCYKKNGCSYIDGKIRAFNSASKYSPYIVLRDLDNYSCAPALVKALINNKNNNLILRIAVREAESWLLADKENFSNYLGISENSISNNVENIRDPKEYLINIARKAKKSIREDIVPERGTTAKYGKNYNGCLELFVLNYWDINIAMNVSNSLNKAITAIKKYKFRGGK